MTRSRLPSRREVAAHRAELRERRSDLGVAVDELYRRLVTAYVVLTIGMVGLVYIIARVI